MNSAVKAALRNAAKIVTKTLGGVFVYTNRDTGLTFDCSVRLDHNNQVKDEFRQVVGLETIAQIDKATFEGHQPLPPRNRDVIEDKDETEQGRYWLIGELRAETSGSWYYTVIPHYD